MTCVGNSGELLESATVAATMHPKGQSGMAVPPPVLAAVLSGNRNFESRVHPLVAAAYLASPPLVVAFALAGRVDIDMSTEPIGLSDTGTPVFLADVWCVLRGHGFWNDWSCHSSPRRGVRASFLPVILISPAPFSSIHYSLFLSTNRARMQWCPHVPPPPPSFPLGATQAKC